MKSVVSLKDDMGKSQNEWTVGETVTDRRHF